MMVGVDQLNYHEEEKQGDKNSKGRNERRSSEEVEVVGKEADFATKRGRIVNSNAAVAAIVAIGEMEDVTGHIERRDSCEVEEVHNPLGGNN